MGKTEQFPSRSELEADAHVEHLNKLAKQALEDVVDIVMAFGEYPQPRRGVMSHAGTREFDLHAFLRSDASPIDVVEVYDFLAAGVTDFGSDFDDKRWKFEKRVRDAVTEHLKDGPLVEAKFKELLGEAEEA